MVVITDTSSTPAGKLASRIVDKHEILDSKQRIVTIIDNIAVIYKRVRETKTIEDLIHHDADPEFSDVNRAKILKKRDKLWEKRNDAESKWYARSIKYSKLEKAKNALSDFDSKYYKVLNARDAWTEVVTRKVTTDIIIEEDVKFLNIIRTDKDEENFQYFEERKGKSIDYSEDIFVPVKQVNNNVIQVLLTRDVDKLAKFLDNVEKNYHLKWKVYFDLTNSYGMKIEHATYEQLISLDVR